MVARPSSALEAMNPLVTASMTALTRRGTVSIDSVATSMKMYGRAACQR